MESVTPLRAQSLSAVTLKVG
uniref:Uncharacterized protein n=1 Tax=Anguilla anguilla TaxID=7936 RepID=A0A0E9S1V6_ANGAN